MAMLGSVNCFTEEARIDRRGRSFSYRSFFSFSECINYFANYLVRCSLDTDGNLLVTDFGCKV